MRHRSLLVELCLLAVAAVLAILFLPRGLFRRAEPSTRVVERSRVEATITVGGAPVAAQVELRGPNAEIEGWLEWEDRDRLLLDSTESGPDGHVGFDDVHGEFLWLRAALPDGRLVETSFARPRGAVRRVLFETPAIVPGPAVELRVTGQEPVENGDRVSLMWDRDKEDDVAAIEILATKGEDGRILLPRVPAGHAFIVWHRPRRFTMQGGSAPLGADATSVELEMGRRDPVRGVVMATDGSPLAAAHVSVSTVGTDGSHFISLTSSGSRGEFAFETLTPPVRRSFFVTARTPGRSSVSTVVRSDAPVPTTPCRPRLARASVVYARVRTSDGRPVEGVGVRRANVDGTSVWPSGGERVMVRTGRDGSVRLEGLPNGRWSFQVVGPDWVSAPVGGKGSRGASATLTEGSEVTVDLVAVPSRIVRGTVHDASGRPIAGAVLKAHERPAKGSRRGMLGDDVVESDAAGKFVWRRLPIDVDLSYSVTKPGFDTVLWRDLPDAVDSVDIMLTTGSPGSAATRPMSPVRAPRQALCVTWKDREGRPVEGVNAESWTPGSIDEMAEIRDDTSEADGRYYVEAEAGEPYDIIGVLRTRPEPLVGFAHIVVGALHQPETPTVEVVLGAPDPAHVHLIVIDGVDGAPNRSFPHDGLRFDGGVKTLFDVRNGVIALPTERLKGATLVITAATDEWGFPQDIAPMRVPIDVSTGVTHVRLLPGPEATSKTGTETGVQTPR